MVSGVIERSHESYLVIESNLTEMENLCTARPRHRMLVADELSLAEKAVALAHDEWNRFPLDIGVERY